MQTLLASSLTVAGGFASDAAGAAWDRALQLCVAVGDTREVLMSQAGLAIFLVAQGRLDASGALTRRILRLGEATGDVRCLVTAHFGLGFRAWLLGDLTQAAAELAEVERLCDDDILAYGDVFPWYDPGVISLAISGLVRWLAGDEDDGRQRLEDAIAAARRSGHPFKLAMILYYDAIRSIMANDSEGALRRSEEFGTLADTHGLDEMILVATAVRGWARACDGDASGALDDVRRSCLLRSVTGMKLLTPLLLALLADVCRRAGRRDEASAALDEALAIAAESGERFYEAELQRVRGEVFAEQGSDQLPAARECFRLAASTARAQGAVPFERRALAAARASAPDARWAKSSPRLSLVPGPAARTWVTRLSAHAAQDHRHCCSGLPPPCWRLCPSAPFPRRHGLLHRRRNARRQPAQPRRLRELRDEPRPRGFRRRRRAPTVHGRRALQPLRRRPWFDRPVHHQEMHNDPALPGLSASAARHRTGAGPCLVAAGGRPRRSGTDQTRPSALNTSRSPATARSPLA